MILERKSVGGFLAVFAPAALFVSLSSAAVPPDYQGVPYPLGSAPKEILGRIDFHDYDKGGPGISFVEDDMASGHWGGCCAGLRDTGIYADGDPDHPSFTRTNLVGYPPDTFYAAGVSYPNGVPFPSPDTSFAANDWYIGACHSNNWFNVTIHVPKPGKYWMSAFWTAMLDTIQYQVFFIGTQYSATKDTIKTDTVNLSGTNSYHAWRKCANFASIQLDSGVQIMKFYNESWHLNQDYLYFSADSGDFPTPVQQPASRSSAGAQSNLSIDRGTVKFSVPDAGKTKISVFDCRGREIMPVLNKTLSAGSHSAQFNTANLNRGIYFVRMEQGGVSSVAKFQSIR